MKEKPKKSAHSALSNALWSFRTMLRSTPQSFWLIALAVPLSVFLAWAEIRLPALVVAEVTQGQSFAHAAAAVGLLLGATLLAAALNEFLQSMQGVYATRFRFRQDAALDAKSMRCFYQQYESKAVRDLRERASSALWMNAGSVPFLQVPQQAMSIVQNLLCYFLFGTVISFASPWLVLLLTLAPLVNWFCVRVYNRYEYRARVERADLEKIVLLEIAKLSGRLQEQGRRFTVDPEVVGFLIDKGYQAEYGARPLRRAIERYLEDALAEDILHGYFHDSEAIRARLDNGRIIFVPEDAEPLDEPGTVPAKKSKTTTAAKRKKKNG